MFAHAGIRKYAACFGGYTMKCPNCGAEVSGKFCEYCGNEMPQEKPAVNITHNYYTNNINNESSSNINRCHDDNIAICPNCGHSRIMFRREEIETTTKSRLRNNYYAFGKGKQRGKAVSQTTYRTVGVCQDCGYTWEADETDETAYGGNKRTWLWVLGWIFMFPLPITILLMRKKEMNAILKYGIIIAAWIVYFTLGLTSIRGN